MDCSEIAIGPELKLYYTGPSFDRGALGALFYFSLSGPDSLCVDPYNQIVQFLEKKQLRIFSLTLPFHEEGLSPLQAMASWAQEMQQGKDPLEKFLQDAEKALNYLIDQKLVTRIVTAGLSRGALLAGLFAARREEIHAFLGLSPITSLRKSKEFQHLPHSPLLDRYDLGRHAALASKQVRFCIGNRDTRVGTRECFECAEKLVQAAHELRSPQIELCTYPSVGQMGHGTPPEIFAQGAEWIAGELNL